MIERAVGVSMTLIGVVGGILGAAASENFSLIGAGSFTAFALAGFTLMWRTWSRENRRLSRRADGLELAHWKAEWRFDLLVKHMRQNGLDVPAEVWLGPTEEEIREALGR